MRPMELGPFSGMMGRTCISGLSQTTSVRIRKSRTVYREVPVLDSDNTRSDYNRVISGRQLIAPCNGLFKSYYSQTDCFRKSENTCNYYPVIRLQIYRLKTEEKTSRQTPAARKGAVSATAEGQLNFGFAILDFGFVALTIENLKSKI